ncbi:amidase [Collimonas sp. OK607]|uniref:amidase n=1 Tax=Collimonas sp. OK607 TaxID=1798194 RepID=UPI000B80B701|nr:amidase [Collimonas sp. OK607]
MPSHMPRRRFLKAGAAVAGASLLGPIAQFAHAAPAGSISADEYAALDATAMADAVRRGSISADALLAGAIARCDAVNGKVNAVVMRHDDHARALLAELKGRAQAKGGALAGVPMLVKDLNTYIAGTITTNSCRLFKDGPAATRTSTLIERYENAGAMTFGKTAAPEFGLTTTTESRQWGITRNPWNLAMSAGGSSGGAAAAVAAGIIPAAHATDGGGSIRIPASYCGVFGLKPSRYRTPSGPDHFEGWFGASVAHVVSRSVRDSALLLDVGQGHEKGSPYWCGPMERPFVAELGISPGKLRVALVADSLTGVPLDPAVRKTLDDTVRLLLSLGHEVEATRLPVDAGQLFGAHGAIVGNAILTAVHDREKFLGRKATDDELAPVTRHVMSTAAATSGEALYRARQTFETIGMSMDNMFDKYDIILSPVTATVTPLLGKLSMEQDFADYGRAAMGSAAFTVVANVSGQPAMSVPLGVSETGMPIGMMFTARIHNEALLFRVAAQLERERPWAQRRAKIV